MTLGKTLHIYCSGGAWRQNSFELVEFYSEDGLEMAIHWSPGRQRGLQVSRILHRRCLEMAGHSGMALWERDSAWLLLKSSRTELLKSVESYLEDSLEIAIHQWHWGRMWMFFVEVSRDSQLFQSVRVLLGRWSWNDNFLTTLPRSPTRQLFELVELYLGDVLEMADDSVVKLWADTKWFLLLSSGTELFKLVELYFRDGV